MLYSKLRFSKGCNNPKDLKGVLSVLDRCLDDGGNGSIVPGSFLGAEAPADFQFGLGRSQCLLGVIIRGRNSGIGEEGKDIVPVFGNAFFEFIKFIILPVFFRVNRRSFEQLVQSFFHIFPDRFSNVIFIAMMDGVPQQVEHVKAPWIIRKGLHRVGKVPQQMGNAYLVILHPHVSHEVGRKSVSDPYHITLLFPGKVLVDHMVASAAVKGEEGGYGILESPEPVIFPVHVDSGFVRPGNLSFCNFLTDHFVGRFGEFPHGLQHVRYGAFTDVESEDGLVQMGESLERNILVSAEVGCHRHDVGAEGYGSIHLFRKLPLAAMPAGALDLHRHVVDNRGRNRKRNVHHLACGADDRSVHLQRLSTFRTHGEGVPLLGFGYIFGLEQGAPRMAFLPTGLPAGRLALGLCMPDANWIPGGRDATVRAILYDGFPATPEFGNMGCKLGNTSLFDFYFTVTDRKNKIHPRKFPVLLLKGFDKSPVDLRLHQQPLCQFCGVKLFAKAEFPKDLPAPPGELYPVCLDTLSKSCIKVLFHTSTKIGKIMDLCKFNDLCTSGLKDASRHFGKTCTPSFGGSFQNFLRACNALQIAHNKLIYNNFNAGIAA